MAGLMDIALHPRFAENKWVYISYHKPRGIGKDADGKDFPVASNSILRGTWDGKRSPTSRTSSCPTTWTRRCRGSPSARTACST